MTTATPSFVIPMDEEQCWQAVCERNPATETRFVYAVLSTGIYCRPTCSARRPRRENARFFVAPAQAEAAGFRPCKRCLPDQAPRSERQAALITAACRWLEEASEPPSLQELATRAELSPYHFHRLFKRLVGVTPYRYAREQRTRRFANNLRAETTVTGALYQAGYNASSRCYEEAPQVLGMTPGRYRNGAAGIAIRYTLRPCSLGLLLMAATERGICAVQLGDDAETLELELQRRFPQASLESAEQQLQPWVDAVLQSLDNPGLGSALPLDIQGSAFQIQVWEALQQIPPGSTASYASIARQIGQPGAARAVARACASNPLALLIPCHRVVRADGTSGGYRWGEQRKRTLLAREQQAHHDGE